jgi:hypothetical protein
MANFLLNSRIVVFLYVKCSFTLVAAIVTIHTYRTIGISCEVGIEKNRGDVGMTRTCNRTVQGLQSCGTDHFLMSSASKK